MKKEFFLLVLFLHFFILPSNCQDINFTADSVQMDHCGHGVYIIKKDRVFYKKDVPMLSSIRVTRPEQFDCDISSFEILKKGYAKDKYNIFYNGVKLNNVYYNSFSILEIDHSHSKDRREEPLSNIYGYYAKDKYQVFYGEKILTGADPETIEMLSPKYVKDKRYAYIKGNIIENADAISFTFVTGRFAKDKSHVYYLGKVISDYPDSFQIVDYKYRYAKDKKYAYHWYGIHPINIDTIVEVNVEDIEPLTHFRATDGEHIYWFGQLIPNADVETFNTINKDYSFDQNFAYYRTKIISGANPTSYEIIDKYYTKDNEAVFFMEKLVEGADPNSFTVLDYTWGKDKDCIYYQNNRRDDIDYKSFSVDNYSRDKYYIYNHNGERTKKVNQD